MIVFDLKCGAGHVFEAWFASSAAYEDQVARSLVSCPVCGDSGVAKAVMAPNVGVKGNAGGGGALPPEVVQAKAMMATLAAAQRKALKDSTWVGERFAQQARAMHDGVTPTATIHGRATPAEARSLVEDGVPVAPLLLPVVPPERVN